VSSALPGPAGMAGRRVVLTGATSGIGLAAAQALGALGADLAIVARSEALGMAAAAAIRAAGSGAVDLYLADLASPASVRRLAEELLAGYPRIDVLVNNAGAMHDRRRLTEDGVELTWAVNHLAPFLLTNLLLDRLRESAPARVVTTSSHGHAYRGVTIPFDDLNADRSYRERGMVRYGQTKLANILFTAELARRLGGTGVTATCFDPGLVATNFNRNNGAFLRAYMTLLRPFSRSPRQGADTLVWLAASPEAEGATGGYFHDRKPATPAPAARDLDAARRLWEVSERQTSLEGGPGSLGAPVGDRTGETGGRRTS
jgi:NAD(P)-dependent dehydrogenase (short-subunit alcohol dehydrogenase family)